ncbi:hypothetical protein LCGC14_1967000, partial [marine sediment metagenome]
MMFPLWQLAGLLASSYWLNDATFKSADLEPKILGMDAAKVFTGVGAIMGLFLGGFPSLAAIGWGAAGAGLVNLNTRKHVEEAAQRWTQESLMATPGLFGPPAGLLGPPAESPAGFRPFQQVPGIVSQLLA